MNVIRRRGWEIPERLATPEAVFLNRRADRSTVRRRSSPHQKGAEIRISATVTTRAASATSPAASRTP